MKSWKTFVAGACALLMVHVAVPATLAAQTIWQDHTRPQSVWLDTHHVEFEGEGSGILSTSNVVGGRLSTSESMAFTVEIPFGYADIDDRSSGAPNRSRFGIGSAYVGLEYAPTASFLLESGVRLPWSSTSSGATVGLFGEFADRPAAYLADVLSIHLVPNLMSTFGDGFRARLRGGPALWIPTQFGAPELLLDYGGSLGVENEGFGADVGITGWMLVSEEGPDFAERTVFQAGAQAYRRLGNGGRLRMLFRLPLDHGVEHVDFTLGVSASVPVG